jgi:hypothetical protein
MKVPAMAHGVVPAFTVCVIAAESNWRNEYPDEDEYGEETPQDLAHDGWRDLPPDEVCHKLLFDVGALVTLRDLFQIESVVGRPLGWQVQEGAALLQSFRSWRQPTTDQMLDDFGVSDDEQQERYWGDDDDDGEELY